MNNVGLGRTQTVIFDDQDIGRGVGYHDHASTGVINVIVNLKKGDVVLLRHSTDVDARRETIHGNRHSELVGYIL